MADIYWVAVGAATAASTTANWNTNPDGSGSATAPTTNDTIHFGDEVSLTAGKGYAKCNYDITTTLTHLKTSSGYNSATVTSTDISFTAAATITHSHSNWEDLGFGVGMYITVSGAVDAANNQPRTILTISSNTMTVSASPSLATEAAGANVTITSDISLNISASFTTKQLTLNTKIINTSGSNATIKFVGSPPDASNRYVFNGESAVLENVDDLTYEYDTGVSDRVLFDDGPYPIVVGTSTNFSPEYYAPTTDQHGSVEMRTLRLDASCTFAPNTSPAASPTLNASKVFDITKTSNFQLNLNTFDTGLSTFTFAPDNNNWPLPISGDTSYGSGAFVSKFYNLIIRTPGTAGHVTLIPSDRTLSVNSLTVESGAVLRGQTTVNTGTTSTICSVRRPLIKGAWNFSQLSDGVYVSVLSDSFPITPSNGAKGRVQISNGAGTFSSDSKLTWASGTSTLLVDGKLTVTGLIDPTGMEFTSVASNPGNVAAKTLWVNSGDSDKLYFGASEVGGGGGGGGDITAVNTNAPITGGATSGAVTLSLSAATTSAAGSMSGADKTKLDAIEASADVTDTANVTAAGALMDSEVTNLAEVKAFAASDYATAAQGALADTALQSAADVNISALTANTAIADADLLLLDDGANGTNRKITFTEVKEWIRGQGVLVGRDGGVNELRIRDSRDDGDVHPNEFTDKAVSFDFTDDITGSPNSWDSVMTLKGWSDNYRAWQIFSSSSSGSQSVDTVPLFFRSGEEDVQDGWGQTKEILTFPGTAPRVDGSNGQVLQTNGSGVLSWATISGGSVAPITLDTVNNRVGINEASPDYDLHVHSDNSNYSVKFEHGEGQTLFNRFGHILIQNDNTSPTDGSTLDNPVWQMGQRDGGQFDIALGNISTQFVPSSKKLIELKRVGNSESGAIQIGFFGATAASQPSAQDPMAFGFNPGTATANELALQQSIDSIIAALQSLGLSA